MVSLLRERIDHSCLCLFDTANARIFKSWKEHGKEWMKYGSKIEILMKVMDATIYRNGIKHVKAF